MMYFNQSPARDGKAVRTLRELKTIAIVLIAAIINPILICAQSKSGKQSYNYTRATEEMQQGNYDEAMILLDKEIKENPNNGYAYYDLAYIQNEHENYAEAMTNINTAIKKLPKKDKYVRGKALASRANLYTIVGDTINALADFDQAAKIDPTNPDILYWYGQLLYELKRYSDADEIYSKIVSLNPNNVIGYMGLGRDAYEKGNFEEAVRQYNIVLNMYGDSYYQGYPYRAESYLKLGKYREAADDLIKAISHDNNDTMAFTLLLDFPDNQLTLVITKLKGMAVKDPHNATWQYIIGRLYYNNDLYLDAIEAFRKAYDIDANSIILECIACCHYGLGEYPQALEAIAQAQQMDPDDLDVIIIKANILEDSGDIDGAIAECTRYIEKAPDSNVGYATRGSYEINLPQQTDQALEDFDMAIMLDPDDAESYFYKGDILMRQGKNEEAMEAYRKVIELVAPCDTALNTDFYTIHAYLALGEKKKAVDFMERAIANNPTDGNTYYNGACFYSRLGDMDKALNYLRIAFENGYRGFHHMMVDYDLVQLRATDGFNTLVEEYQRKPKPTVDSKTDTGSESEIVEIPFTPENGCISVKCSINGLPLSFLFDTGASVVSLSQIEANFMLKNGYLKKDDFIGANLFVDANGDISEGTMVNLRDVDFGGLNLKNVRASIVRNQKAPLLLGQSVLGRLGSIGINYPEKKLIITHSK